MHRSVRPEEVGTAGTELTGTPAPPRRGADGGSGCGRPRCRTGGRWRTPPRGGSSEPSVRKRSETGPARRRRARARTSKVARSRTRQIRPRDASGRGRGAARSTARPPLVRMRRRKPWVLARLRLLGWYVRFNEEPPRGGRARPEVGDHAGGGNGQVYGSGDAPSQRGARVWGKPPQPLVAQGRRCYVARLARLRPAGRDFPGASRRDQADLGAPLPTISTPVDAPVDNSGTADAPGSGNPAAAAAVERDGSVTADELWDQGAAALRNQLAPATWAAWFHGVRPLSYDGDSARAQRARARSRPNASAPATPGCSPTPSATPPARPCRSTCSSRPTPEVRESLALAPPPVTVVVDEHDLDPMPWHRRSPAPTTRAPAPGPRAR